MALATALWRRLNGVAAFGVRKSVASVAAFPLGFAYPARPRFTVFRHRVSHAYDRRQAPGLPRARAPGGTDTACFARACDAGAARGHRRIPQPAPPGREFSIVRAGPPDRFRLRDRAVGISRWHPLVGPAL